MKERGCWPIDLFGKNEKKLLQLAYCCSMGEKRRPQNYVGGLLVQIMAGKRLLVVEEKQKKKIAGCFSLLYQREKH
jgi:hypothetical protein